MESLEPIINLLVVLTALSVAAERLTNVLKLRNPQLREPVSPPAGGKQPANAAPAAVATEKQREERITNRGVLVGVLLALLLKADLLAILGRLDAPWDTLGWLQLRGSTWMLASLSAVALPQVLLGCVATGIALGFGSKFWHEVLDAAFELRNMAKLRNQRSRTPE